MCRSLETSTYYYAEIYDTQLTNKAMLEEWRAFLRNKYSITESSPRTSCIRFAVKDQQNILAYAQDEAGKEGKKFKKISFAPRKNSSAEQNSSSGQRDAGGSGSKNSSGSSVGYKNQAAPSSSGNLVVMCSTYANFSSNRRGFVYAIFPGTPYDTAKGQWNAYISRNYPQYQPGACGNDVDYLLNTERNIGSAITKVDFVPKHSNSNANPTPGKSATDEAKGSSSGDMQAAKRLDQRQEANFIALIERSEAEERAALSSGKPQRRKVYPPQRPQCLRVVDIKQGNTNKRLYFYAIQNVCNEPMHAHWCAGEKADCRLPRQAWLIQPNEKEGSWMLSRTGAQGVQFYGTACVDKHRGQQVYYDKKSGTCWAWDAGVP